jgi:hypothetical protein
MSVGRKLPADGYTTHNSSREANEEDARLVQLLTRREDTMTERESSPPCTSRLAVNRFRAREDREDIWKQDIHEPK